MLDESVIAGYAVSNFFCECLSVVLGADFGEQSQTCMCHGGHMRTQAGGATVTVM